MSVNDIQAGMQRSKAQGTHQGRLSYVFEKINAYRKLDRANIRVKAEHAEMVQEIIKLRLQDPPISYRAIARKFNIKNNQTVKTIIETHEWLNEGS